MTRVRIDGRPIRPPYSGVAQYILNLSAGLRAQGVDFELRCYDWLGRDGSSEVLAHRGLHSNSRVHRFLHRKVLTAASLSGLPSKVLTTGQYDVWHATYFERFPHLPRGVGTVGTVHDLMYLDLPTAVTPAIARGSARGLHSFAERADAIICVSEFTRQRYLAETSSREQLVVTIPLGVDAPPEGEALPTPDRPYFLYLGNLEPRKGIIDLIAAWRAAKLSPDFDLIIAGAAAYMADEILSAIGAAASESVRWTGGFVSESVKWKLLRQAHAFVYPSHFEGFGIPLLEAMAVGTPVVSCRTSSIPEVVGDAGLLVEVADEDGLAEALVRLATDQNCHSKLRSEGLRRAQTLTWDQTARRTARVYEEVAR